LAWHYWHPAVSPTILPVSGRIEADETDVGAKTAGRLMAVYVREGDRVSAGQVLAQLADEEISQQLRAAQAQVSVAQQQEQQARLNLDVIASRIREAEVTMQQAQTDSTGRIDQAQANVSVAQAQLRQAQAQALQAQTQITQAQAQVRQAAAQRQLAQRNADRYRQLFAQGAINQQQLDQAETTLDTAAATFDTTQAAVATAQATFSAHQAAVKAAQEQFTAAQGSRTQSQSTGLNPAIRNNQLQALLQQKQQAYAGLAAAQEQVKAAQANQAQVQERIASLQILSPIAGIVQTRPLEPGAVVSSGRTLLTLINPNQVYLRAYIPDRDIGRVHVGMKARVLLDTPGQPPLPATLSAIDPQAMFTPENIYFKQDRVRQVFGVKLDIQQTQGWAKPGMPADAEILLQD
jgi:HlyD family secretion protein